MSDSPLISRIRSKLASKPLIHPFSTGKGHSDLLVIEAAWVVAAMGANVVGKMASVKILTNEMGAQAYGQLALSLTIASVVVQVLTGGIAHGALRFFGEKRQRGQLASLVVSLVQIMAYVTAITLGLGLIATWITSRTAPEWTSLILTSLWIGLAQSSTAIIGNCFSAVRKRSVGVLGTAIGAIFPILGAVTFLRWFTPELGLALTGYALGATGVTVYQVFTLWRFFRSELTGPREHIQECLQTLIKYAWPFTVWGIPAWLQLYADRWIVGGLLDVGSVGFYTVLVQLGSMPVVLASATLSRFVSPLVFERVSAARDVASLKSAGRWLLLDLVGLIALGLGMTTVSGLFSAQIVSWLSTPEFAEYSYLLPWMCLGAGAMELGRHLALIGFAFGKSQVYIAPKIGIVVLGIVLNILSIKQWGLVGTVASLLAVGVTHMAWNAIIGLGLIRQHIVRLEHAQEHTEVH